jgi:hypothetical protein
MVIAAVFGHVVPTFRFILPPPSSGQKKLWTVGVPLPVVISQNAGVFTDTLVLGFCRKPVNTF